jgi:hypothetical protein
MTDQTKTYTISIHSYEGRERKLSVFLVGVTGTAIKHRVVTSIAGLLETVANYEGICRNVGATIEYRTSRWER